MQPATRRIIDQYSSAVSQLTDTGKQILAWKLDGIDWSDVTAGANEAVRIMEQHCGTNARLSAHMAAKLYDGLRVQEVGERLGAEPYDGREPEATENAVRGFVNRIVDKDDVDGFNRLCSDRLDYEIHNAAKKTIGHNTYRDPLRPKYAVVPSGDCCNFCAMLASRGPVYSNPNDCEGFHPHCTCSAVPTWERDKSTGKYVMDIEGYDQDYYLDRYEHPEWFVSERGISSKQSASVSASVDMNYINSGEYAAKFVGITGSEKADAELLKQARAALDHRKGTLKEDLHLVSVLDGETKASSTNPSGHLQTERTKKIAEACKNEPRGSLVGLHNHPDNIPPTGSDITAAGIRGYNAGIAALHDGTIYVYRVHETVPSQLLDMTISSYNEKGYSPVVAGEKALNDLAERGILEWEKR